MNLSGIPNLLTVARMLATVPLVGCIALELYDAAFLIALIAGFSDAVDGLLAKRFNWVSGIGGVMDPLADKMMLVSIFVVLCAQGHIPLWLLLLVTGRDVMIVVGGLFYHYKVEDFDAKPTWISKGNTALQILLAAVVLFALAWQPDWMVWITWLIFAVAATTLVSGLQYVWVYGRKAWSMQYDSN